MTTTSKLSRRDRRVLRNQAKNDKRNASAHQMQRDLYDQLDRHGL